MIIEGEQNTQKWDRLCCGSVGASSVSKILTSKGELSSQREKYFDKIVSEILSNEKDKTGYCSEAMLDGIKRESQTLYAFSLVTGLEIRRIAMIKPFKKAYYHCSPDSIGKENGVDFGVEVKSVQEKTQIKRLKQNKLPTEYVLQCQTSLLISGWETWYFFSYHPNQKHLLIKVERDEKLIAKIKKEVELFIKEVNDLTGRI